MNIKILYLLILIMLISSGVSASINVQYLCKDEQDLSFYETKESVPSIRQKMPVIEYEVSDAPEDAIVEITFEPIFTEDIDEEGYEDPPPWNRRSFFYVTPYREEIEGYNRVLGSSWHMLMWGDGEWHWFNVTGLYEVYFLDGRYIYNENWIMYLHFWAPGNRTFPYNWWPSHLTFSWWYNSSNAKIDYLHICQDHTEDDVYIRTVDRTWNGNWEIENE